MLIGELARRLRLTTRTLRHYEAIGLLVPDTAAERNGYRHYGGAELIRGMQIEQLKAAGLTLAEIGRALGSDRPMTEILAARRTGLAREIGARTSELAVIDALLTAPAPVSSPHLVTLEDARVTATTCATTTGDLPACIRRQVQRLRRELKQREPGGSWTFAAQFPLDVDGPFEVDVAAVGGRPGPRRHWWPGSAAVQVELVGPHSLLPLAYDAALTAAHELRHRLTGVVRETYLDLGATARTAVAVLVDSPAADLRPGSVAPRRASSAPRDRGAPRDG